jgi:hypothetical protein
MKELSFVSFFLDAPQRSLIFRSSVQISDANLVKTPSFPGMPFALAIRSNKSPSNVSKHDVGITAAKPLANARLP